MSKVLNIKNILTFLLIVILGMLPVMSYELDMSVDEEIKKKYDSDKLKYDLPPLPKTTPTSSPSSVGQSSAPKTTPVYSVSVPNVTKVTSKDGLKIPYGTKFQVHSNQPISDWQRSGTNISFTSYAPVYKGAVSIPSGTKFYGVEDSKNLGVRWDWDTIPQSKQETNDSNSDSSNYDGSFKFWRGFAFRFNATLNALISNGKARILATPRIITIPGKEASIFIGDHIPVQTEKHDSSGSYTATEYLDAGIKLQYAPIISEDGKMVTASVHTEVSTPVLISELKNYRITSRTADTNVRMYSGETLVIGGLISEEQHRTMQKVPFLSKIPLLGELFKNRSRSHNKTEVLLLLTPHITEAGASPAIYNEGLKKEEGK